MEYTAYILLGAAVGGVAAFLIAKRLEATRVRSLTQEARTEAERIVEAARAGSGNLKRAAELEAKEEILRGKEAWEEELQRRRSEIERTERRLDDRESLLDRKLSTLDQKHELLDTRASELEEKEGSLEKDKASYQELLSEHRRKLERASGISAGEAKRELIREVEEEARADAAQRVRELKEEAMRGAEREGRNIIAMAIEKTAADHAVEVTVSVVHLPNDEMKGRIIGREGRNIRAFETATGVDVIIDDTPDTVVVSCFDPIRREIARLALEQLVSDGRIHPGRIEEVVKKITEQVDQQLLEAGEQATYEFGIHGMHEELVRLVGRMKFRTSYGQNMYHHSKEVAWLSGIMASELKLDVHLAKRGALLHDIGKVLTHQHEGTHVELGVEVAKKYGEHEVVINCIAAHHDDVPHETPISVIVQAADSASGARPGARREALETYVKRLTKLEEIANSFKGVEKTFAIQAGREVRIVVTPDKVSDVEAVTMSEEIARRIEEELQYPGQIKVVVVRETRAVDIAR